MPVEKIQWDKHDIVTCDERGRATLGKEYANKQVFVYIAEPPSPEEGVEPNPDEKRVLEKMADWAITNLQEVDWITLNAEKGVVVDKHGNEYDTPYMYESDRDV